MALSMPPEYSTTADGSYILRKPDGTSIHYEKYRYKHRLTERSIRLLRPNFDLRNPAHRSQGLFNHFLLEEHSLGDFTPEYVPVSYSWGPDKDLVPLTMGSEDNGSVILITPAAWQAIQKLSAGVPLWVDQACINQSDDREMEAQIGLMREIYSSPRRFTTVVWLGAADNETKVAFDFVALLSKALPLDQDIPIDANDAFHMPHDLIQQNIQARMPKYRPPPPHDPGWASLAMILARSWFTRMWTFQEVVFSNADSVSIVCAFPTMMCATTLTQLLRASILLGGYDIPGWNDAIVRGRASLRTITLTQYHLKNGLPLPLGLLLDATANRDCEQPRDKIYALLGFEDQLINTGVIEVDLRRSDRDVYIDVTRKIIVAESSLSISLSASGRSGGRVDQLPTWVPDYTGTILSPSMDTPDLKRLFFSASRGRKFDGALGSEIARHELTVRGHDVDKVMTVLDSEIPDKASADDIYSYFRAWLPQLLGHLKEVSNENDSTDSMIQIARTVVIDGLDSHVHGFPKFSFISRAESDTQSASIIQDGGIKYPVRDSEHEEDMLMLRFMFSLIPSVTVASLGEERQRRWKHNFAKQGALCKGRRFALLGKYKFGLVPRHTRALTDIVTVLHGSSVPVVLRANDAGKFELIGPCFVYGIMRGEAVNWAEDSARSYTLV